MTTAQMAGDGGRVPRSPATTRPEPYAPRIDYLCDDADCCRNGCPVVVCRTCGKCWPCADYIAAHTPAQVAQQRRWVERVWGDGA